MSVGFKNRIITNNNNNFSYICHKCISGCK